MNQAITEVHNLDDEGRPAGGETVGTGISIIWQNGPLEQLSGMRSLPNGAFVEGVISAAIGRLEFYQTAAAGAFRCRENALAITKLQEALHWLDARTKARERAGVEGTHKPRDADTM